jgi:hypothetical protein
LNGSRLSQWDVASGVRRVGYRDCKVHRRCDVAVCASGLMSAHEYEAMLCPVLSRASSPVAIPAQISTTWRGLFGMLYGRTCVSVGSCGQDGWDGSDKAGEVGEFQFGEGVSVERGRGGGFGGGVVGCRTGVGVGKSSM